MNYQLTDQTGYNIAAILRSRGPRTRRQFQKFVQKETTVKLGHKNCRRFIRKFVKITQIVVRNI